MKLYRVVRNTVQRNCQLLELLSRKQHHNHLDHLLYHNRYMLCTPVFTSYEVLYSYLFGSVSVLVICQYNIYLTDVGVMHEAGYVILSAAPSTISHLDNNILFIFHYLGSPLS